MLGYRKAGMGEKEDNNAATKNARQIVERLELLLQNIESQGGEFNQGRVALERLRQELEKQRLVVDQRGTLGDGSSILVQIDTIKRGLERIERRVESMSDATTQIVSFADVTGALSSEGMLSKNYDHTKD